MKYPILNISIEKWNNNDIDYSIILLEEGVIYTSNKNIYTKFFLNNKYIDSNGSIYKIVDRKLPASWKKIFSFLPNFYKVKFRFEKTEESMQIADLKSHIIDNIKRFNGIEDFEANWLSRIKVATTFEQILKQ